MFLNKYYHRQFGVDVGIWIFFLNGYLVIIKVLQFFHNIFLLFKGTSHHGSPKNAPVTTFFNSTEDQVGIVEK